MTRRQKRCVASLAALAAAVLVVSLPEPIQAGGVESMMCIGQCLSYCPGYDWCAGWCEGLPVCSPSGEFGCSPGEQWIACIGI
jgi:hypothetical protein